MYVIDLFKDWGGHIFSICGIIGGLFMYYRHDKIIKKQEKFLNELQIKQIKKQKNKSCKPKLSAILSITKKAASESVSIIQGRPMLVMSV